MNQQQHLFIMHEMMEAKKREEAKKETLKEIVSETTKENIKAI